MRKIDAERFLKKVEGFASAERMDEKLSLKFTAVLNSANKIGFPHLPNGIVIKDEQVFIQLPWLRLIHKDVRNMLGSFAETGGAEVLQPSGLLQIGATKKQQQLKVHFAAAEQTKDSQTLCYAIAITMIVADYIGVFQCGNKKCGKYHFTTNRKRKFCNDNCRQRAFHQ